MISFYHCNYIKKEIIKRNFDFIQYLNNHWIKQKFKLSLWSFKVFINKKYLQKLIRINGQLFKYNY